MVLRDRYGDLFQGSVEDCTCVVLLPPVKQEGEGNELEAIQIKMKYENSESSQVTDVKRYRIRILFTK